MFLKEVFFKQFARIGRREWPRALLLSGFFFLIIATYWILKPIKRGVIINYFGEDPMQLLGMTFSGAEAEQIGKLMNMVAVYLIVLLFTYLSRRLPRHYLVATFAGLFSATFALFAWLIQSPTEPVVWSFYILGDMFNTAMVALFWAFSNDIATSDEAKRTYGIIGLGGVVGGFIGATIVNTYVEQFGRSPLLLFCIVPMVLMTIIAFIVHKRETDGSDEQLPAAEGRGANVALEGAKLVLKSKYLLAIAGIIGIYELTSNIIDYQLAATVERTITESLAKDEFFGLVGQLIGIISIGVQLALTTYVLRRFGVRVALFFLPIAVLAGSAGFLILPTLFFAAAMSVSDNALNYSINQSAKEALYTPTNEQVTYKAKAFIDMFVQRFSKVVSVVLNLAIAAIFVSGERWLSLFSLVMIAGWLYLVWYAGSEFKRITGGTTTDDADPDADADPETDEAERDTVEA